MVFGSRQSIPLLDSITSVILTAIPPPQIVILYTVCQDHINK